GTRLPQASDAGRIPATRTIATIEPLGGVMNLLRLLLSAALACAASPPFDAALAQSENLRVGFLTVRTGPLAAGGRQMEEGINLLLKERNNTLGGRKVQIFFAETDGQPAKAKTKSQEHVGHGEVHVFIGSMTDYVAVL